MLYIIRKYNSRSFDCYITLYNYFKIYIKNCINFDNLKTTIDKPPKIFVLHMITMLLMFAASKNGFGSSSLILIEALYDDIMSAVRMEAGLVFLAYLVVWCQHRGETRVSIVDDAFKRFHRSP